MHKNTHRVYLIVFCNAFYTTLGKSSGAYAIGFVRGIIGGCSNGGGLCQSLGWLWLWDTKDFVKNVIIRIYMIVFSNVTACVRKARFSQVTTFIVN